MRLIDADACLKLFDEEFKETKRLILDGEKHLDNLAEGFMEANNVIRSMPTIDAAPVVHGRWKYHKYVEKYECTGCGHFVRPGTDRNYCPNCGAKMDLQEKEDKKTT